MTDLRNRREFMGLAAAGVAGVFTSPWSTIPGVTSAAHSAHGPASVDPDLVVFNARIYTMESGAPRAEANLIWRSRKPSPSGLLVVSIS